MLTWACLSLSTLKQNTGACSSQVADDGTSDVSKFWRDDSVRGTLGNGEGSGEIDKGGAQVRV